MIEHFESDPKLGAAVFTITLPDGSRECSAYPGIFSSAAERDFAAKRSNKSAGCRTIFVQQKIDHRHC